MDIPVVTPNWRARLLVILALALGTVLIVAVAADNAAETGCGGG